MPLDEHGRSQPPVWTEPETPPKQVFGPVPATPPLPHSANPNGDGPGAQPQARPLQHLTNEQLTVLAEDMYTGAPGGEPIITGYGCIAQVSGEIAIQRASGQWPPL